jgi:hypothetical protein
VIRIDDEVLAELKKRAIDFGLVFEPRNATLRKLLGLASQTASEPQASVLPTGNECRMLLDRIERTLTAVNFDMDRIRREPGPFCEDDICIFRGLSEAILSNRAVWSSVKPHLNTIAQALYGYNIDKVANLSNDALNELYMSRLKPLKIRSMRLRKGLREIRDNAKAFQHFRQEHGAIRNFILSYLNDGGMPQLRGRFIGKYPGFKLHGVGVAICSEFFNNIGIDEFKGDSNTTRFFRRIGMAEANSSPDDIRTIGITIAKNSEKPRVFVDSLIWCFCAQGEAEICTTHNPKCHLCKLNTKEPRLCTYCGSLTTPSTAGPSHEGRNSPQLARLVGETTPGGQSQSDSNLPEKEVEMGLKSATGVIISADINDLNQTPYKKGYAANLLIVDMGIDKGELSKLLSAYRSHYTKLFSYGKYPRKKSGYVPITIVFGQHKYQVNLKKPQKREGAWIPSGPVYDVHGHDVKLAGALNTAGFRVKSWTHQARTLSLPNPQSRLLQQVKFLVQGMTWTLLSHSGSTHSGVPPTPKAHR